MPVDSLDQYIEQLLWIKEWARVSIAYEESPAAFEVAKSRFYGGEMSCAGMLYTPMFGLVASSADSAYLLAFEHSLFDHGFAKDLSGLVAAMTYMATQTSSIDSVLDVVKYVDPHGFSESRLVGRIPFSVAENMRTTVLRARAMLVEDTLLVREGGLLRIPRGYPGSREDWVRQDFVYRILGKDAKSIAFHAEEIWQILIAALAWGDGDFEQTMQFIVNYGRDNDTVAALAGTILGAQVGFDGLPPKQAEKVLAVTLGQLELDLKAAATDLEEMFR